MELNENSTENTRLEELGGSNYDIVDGEPNIKGWEVKNPQGEKIGEIDELLFDPQSRSVRYLIVDLDDNELDLENEDRKVLIPIGLAELHSDETDDEYDEQNEAEDDTSNGRIRESDREAIMSEDEDRADEDDSVYDPREDDDVVILPNITAKQLNALPAYEKNGVTPEMETTIRSILEGTGLAGAATTTDDFYNHEHFNEDRFYNGRNAEKKLPVIKEDLNVGKQEVDTGGARITGRLVERPIQENINLKQEHVNIERTPVNRPVNEADKAFQETELEMTEHAEVPVVSKEARVVEEVSLHKTIDEKEEIIRDTVRNTEVDAERLPGERSEASNNFDNV